MLGFDGVVCYPHGARFGGGKGKPIWMDDLNCYGNEEALDLCYFPGWGRHDCGHYEDAGLVCNDGEENCQILKQSMHHISFYKESSVGMQVGIPSNIQLIASSISTLTIGWTVSQNK